MQSGPHDLARVRLDNALALFDEFVRNTVKSPDAATLRGLESRFAERLQIQPSYWSQIKSHARQIGERLARQFERQCRKPVGWMDVPHGSAAAADPMRSQQNAASGAAAARAALDNPVPQDDDERFIVGLVLTYYRRHPQRARTRLLDLLGEVLSATPAATPPTSASAKSVAAPGAAPQRTVPKDDGQSLWHRSQRDVAPLKRKR